MPPARSSPASWDDAIRFVAEGLKRNVLEHGPEQLGALVSPATSSEEGLLLALMLHSLGCDNIDHRLRLLDAGDASAGHVFEMPLADIAQAGAILLVGSDPARDAPLLGHRVRTAWKRGATVYSVDVLEREFTFDVAERLVATPAGMVDQMLGLARAVAEFAPAHPHAELAAQIAAAPVGEGARRIAQGLKQGESTVVLFGDAASQHPQATLLRSLARYVARACEAKYDELAQGANAIGSAPWAWFPRGKGLSVPAMLAEPRKTLVLYGAEVPHDFADGAGALRALADAEFVVAFAAFADARLSAMADVILPIGLTPEIDATLVNVDGAVQTVAAGAKLPGEARPGWRILRALGARSACRTSTSPRSPRSARASPAPRAGRRSRVRSPRAASPSRASSASAARRSIASTPSPGAPRAAGHAAGARARGRAAPGGRVGARTGSRRACACRGRSAAASSCRSR
jgi:NADH-quinone oxidoreductase subunit G